MVRSPPHPQHPGSQEILLLEAISGKWTALIVQTLAENTLRHGELQRAIGGISQKVLTQTLRNLERNGVVTRAVYPVVPPQVEYSLTPLGHSLAGLLGDLCVWADEHNGDAQTAREKYDTRNS